VPVQRFCYTRSLRSRRGSSPIISFQKQRGVLWNRSKHSGEQEIARAKRLPGFPRPTSVFLETRMLTSKLKLVDNGDAGVVFPQVGFAIAGEVANATEAWTVIKIDFAKVDILVLRSRAPVSSERIL
jgi:hypothetical protein